MNDTDLAKFIAELINGGEWNNSEWYTKEQRELWRGHARAIMNFIDSDAPTTIASPFRITKN